jgi:hypothetical protein
MKESDRAVPMLYERNDSYVIEAFRQGEFDYLEGVGEVSEVDFFRALAGKNLLHKLADSYPLWATAGTDAKLSEVVPFKAG